MRWWSIYPLTPDFFVYISSIFTFLSSMNWYLDFQVETPVISDLVSDVGAVSEFGNRIDLFYISFTSFRGGRVAMSIEDKYVYFIYLKKSGLALI